MFLTPNLVQQLEKSGPRCPRCGGPSRYLHRQRADEDAFLFQLSCRRCQLNTAVKVGRKEFSRLASSEAFVREALGRLHRAWEEAPREIERQKQEMLRTIIMANRKKQVKIVKEAVVVSLKVEAGNWEIMRATRDSYIVMKTGVEELSFDPEDLPQLIEGLTLLKMELDGEKEEGR